MTNRSRPGGRRNTCKACDRARSRKWHERNWERRAVCAAKFRAKKKGVEFTITEEDIAVPSVCRICLVPLVIGGDQRTSPSVDRILPSLGYIPDNIWVICGECNRQKNDSTPEQMRQIADAVENTISTRGLVVPEDVT